MANTYLSFHGCTDLRIESAYPGNSNSITLEVSFERSELGYRSYSQITFYDLPTEITDKLIEALGDPSRIVERAA